MSPPPLRTETQLADYMHDVGPAGIVLFEGSPPFRVLSTNKAYLDLWPEPLRSRGLVGLALAEFIPDAEETGVAEVFRQVASTRTARHIEEFSYKLADGLHWFNWSLVPVIREGEVVALANMAVDVTREVLIRKELDAERMRWRGVVEGIADEVWVCDAEGTMTLINLPETTAMGLEAFEGKPIEEVLANVDIFYPDGRPRPPDEAPLLRALRSGEILRGEEIMRHRASGRVRHRQFSCAPMRDGAGAITGAVAIARDITAAKMAEASLRRREAEFRALIEELHTGVAVIDSAGKFSVYNRRFLELFGLAHDAKVKDVNDQDWAKWQVFDERGTLLHVDDHPVRKAALTRTRVSNQLVGVRAPGNPESDLKWLMVSAEPLLAENGAVERIVCTYYDITEQHEADRRKDEFLGMLSHELRNPLAPIRNSTFILQRATPGSEQARRAQSVIERQTEHLTRLVDDLLDVTRIARGKIELRRSRVDLREVVLQAAEDFRLLMEDRGVVLRTVMPDAEVWSEVDATRMTQVVGNLLHNAAKFTRRGGEVILTLSTRAGEATVTVRDTGIGIHPELLPTVFDAFVQGERTLARTDGGLGLGLALVKRIAELHGGSVHAHSAGNGKGAEFTVRLRLLPVRETEASPRAPTERQSGGRRVLVVDDNRDAAESLADVVRMLGYRAEVAYDGPSAIEKARADPPNVVLCDVGLPGMSGYEVAKALRGMSVEPVQLIAVSGYAQPEDVKRAIDAGFDGHVAKPCDPEKIQQLLG